jgi:hypothetical protein
LQADQVLSGHLFGGESVEPFLERGEASGEGGTF